MSTSTSTSTSTGTGHRIRAGWHAGAMEEDQELPDAGQLEQLEELGAFDPDAPGAQDRLDLIRLAMARGATVEEVAARQNLGELALDVQLRPRGSHTLSQVAAESGLEWPKVQRLVAAIGLPSDPAVLLTAGEAESVLLLAAVSRDVLGQSATLQLARVTGNAMARVADTLVGAFRLNIELPHRDAGTRYVDVVKEYSKMADTLLPAFVRTLDSLIRRQIVAVAERMWSTDEERSAVTLLRTVGFVDLVGYTEITAGLSVRELTDMLMEFNQRTGELVESRNGQIVKTIGDEVMFVTEGASAACAIGLDLVDASKAQSAPVRVGLATGEMVSVLGDLYGSNVNLAARLVAAADPGTVIASVQVREAVAGFRFDPLPPAHLKGFQSPVVAYRVLR
jgi:adenylate cyclase